MRIVVKLRGEPTAWVERSRVFEGYGGHMRPVIGISLCLDERGSRRAGRTDHYEDTAYSRALSEAGALVLYLPSQNDPDLSVAKIDGLLLPGGDDFLPPHPYPPDVRFQAVPETQLAFDQGLVAAALARELPVLGICYGMQLLSLQLGGSLHYHLPLDVPKAGPHQSEPHARHAITLTPGTRLARLLGSAPPQVNSSHHQAVADPGAKLRVSARAEDGIIEAVEAPSESFCIGVQWHPERLEPAHRQPLFAAFVEASARKRT